MSEARSSIKEELLLFTIKEYVIDTSSLLNLSRYYFPFDKERVLYQFIESSFKNGKSVLLAEVREEAEIIADKVIMTSMPFLREIKIATHLANREAVTKARNWVYPSKRESLEEKDYEQRFEQYWKTADPHLVLFASESNTTRTVVTEETKMKKLPPKGVFNKIPDICEVEKIPCINLPDYLKELQLGINYHVSSWP